MVKKALGKGLSAIISDPSPSTVDDLEDVVISNKDRIVEVPVDKIKPNPDQPRNRFHEEEIKGLAESIRSVGIIQPIILRKNEDDYILVAGERRLRAAKVAGLQSIKSIIVEANEEENLTIALIENLQRSDLDPIEEARAYKALVNRFNLKQQDIAQRVGKERATVANMIRLLNLPDIIQEAISEGKISIGHSKALLSAPANKQIELYNQIIDKKLSVRELERIVENGKNSKDTSEKKFLLKDPHIKKMEEKLISIFGVKVEIKHSDNGGKIEINYYSLDDFDRIMEIIES